MQSGLLIFLLAISNITVFNAVAGGFFQQNSVAFLDVGQGDSSLVRAYGADILIDVGPDKSVMRGLERLLPRTDKYIDLIIISHPHLDHYGGLEHILSAYDVGAIVWNGADSVERLNALLEKAKTLGIPVIRLFAGSAIRSTGFDMQIVYPVRQAEEKLLAENDGSLVILTETSGLTGLFTGDIGTKPEALISAIPFPEIDFLKISHHGSNTSSSYEFLTATNPRIATLSVGQRNRYGLPNREVLNRFSALGIPVFRTDEKGNIVLTIANNKLRVHSIE